jgi:iron complex transport system substrate-binding protein
MTARFRRSGLFFAVAVPAIVGLGLSLLFAKTDSSEKNPSHKPAPTTEIRRIISAAPSVTEMIFALGQGDRLVGVTDYCTHPVEGIAAKTRIGGLYDPNRERILKLQPDLIVYAGAFEALDALAAEHGIRTLSLDMNTLDQIRDAARRLGRTLNCEQAAEEGVRQFDAELKAVRDRVAAFPAKTVFLCTDHKPADLAKIGTCGPQSFLSELLAEAGGINIFADVRGAWPQISKEALLRRAPEVIVELHPRGMGADPAIFARLRQDWQSLPDIPAVRTGRIYFLTEDFHFVPSVRAPRIAESLARVVHPEAFRE